MKRSIFSLKHKKLLYTIIPFLIFLSCSNSKQKEVKEEQDPNIIFLEGYPAEADSTKFKIQILEHGDIDAYDNLTHLYEFDWKPLLPYAFMMAELHHSDIFNSNIYEGLLSIVKEETNMDPDKKEGLIRLAIYYLKLNLKMDDADLTTKFASTTLIELYEKGELVEKNPELVQYLKGGGLDIDKFREEQKAKESKK